MRRALLIARIGLLHDDEHGQMAFLTVFSLLIVFLFFALSLDAGLWYFDHRWAQTQAEAAALAAAVELPSASTTDATARADDWLIRNGSSAAERSCLNYTDQNGDGRWDTVRVCVRRTAPSIFATLATVPFVWVSAAATATVIEQPSVYALMSMDDTECNTLYLHGGAQVNVTGGGGTYTRSSCNDALHVEGTSQLHDGINDTLTGDALVNGSTAVLDPPATGQDYLDDPYQSLTQPVPTSAGCAITNAQSNINATRTLSPGTYCFQLRLNSTALVTLNPGTYILLNGIQVNAGAHLTGTGVLLYDTCASTRPSPCNGATPADMEFAGGAVLSLHGSTNYQPECSLNPSCPSMVLWVDRTAGHQNPDHPHIRLRGSTAGGIDGRVYNYHGTVDIGGDPGVVMTLNMSVVADHIEFQGNATFDMPFNPLLAPTIRVMSLSD